MPYRISRQGRQYCLRKIEDNTMVPGSCRDSRADTLRMLQAIESNLSEKDAKYHILTPTELVIARYVVSGMGDKHIAAKMSMKASTVNVHMKSIMDKLGINCRSGLALRMLFTGLIEISDLTTLHMIGQQEGVLPT